MNYTFKFKLGDSVQVLSGKNIKVIGTITALELSPKRTVAVLRRMSDDRPIREVESNLQLRTKGNPSGIFQNPNSAA